MDANYSQIQYVYQLMGELEKTIPATSWKKFYSYRIRKFFEEYLSQEEHIDRPLSAITEIEVNNFLKSLTCKHNEKVNYYMALKSFFDYAAKKGVAQPFYIKVNKYVQKRTEIEYIEEKHTKKIVDYISGISGQENLIENRLLLALFLYTGLGRKYISGLSYDQINDKMDAFRLNGVDHEIPIKEELHRLLTVYFSESGIKRTRRIFDVDETALNYRLNALSKEICGKSYTPTQYSNTFIKKALGDQDQCKNIYAVSRLTNESLSTIAKHVDAAPSWIFSEQKILLDKWK